MPKYEVTTDLIIHCKVKVIVAADSKEAAIDAAAELLPANYKHDYSAPSEWRAKVDLKPPRGVEITSVRAHHFDHASGGDKARRLPDADAA